jgi:hypothetical protein
LNKSFLLSRSSRRFNRSEIHDGRKNLRRRHHFRFRVPLQADCCYSWIAQKAFAGAKYNEGTVMKPTRSPACAKPDGSVTPRAAAFHMAFAIFAFAALSGCEQNSFVPPPPPKVDVGMPVQRPVTRYLEATGNTAPINSVDLVARVQGVLQAINYQDGSLVKQGTTLFTIEPDTYKLKLEQAQAAEAGAQASLKQAEADYKRQVDLVARHAVS